MQEQLIPRVIAKFLIPFIILFALYVQLHGEYSPGGGFQAGVILAAAFILYALIFGLSKAMQLIPVETLRIFACIGVLLYAGVGVVTMLKGGNFLNYSVLSSNAVTGQQIGIMLIELGVGITVFSVMLLVFFVFSARKR